MRLDFHWIDEPRPAARWAGLFERTWPAYRTWYLAEGDEARPDLAACRAALARHMPELIPRWEHLCALAGDDELAARMLSLYRPPPVYAGCSQAVSSGDGGPALVRNYDFHPELCEGTFVLTRWGETLVLASQDCLWGALDGINEHGLCVALAFGGRPVTGDGFAITLILRYVLERCRTVAEAAAELVRLPSAMPYNVSCLDGEGRRAVVHVAPDRKARIEESDIATNHQAGDLWQRYESFSRSVDRHRRLERLLVDDRLTTERLADAFLEPPLLRTRYADGCGTIYTVVYRPGELAAVYRWPGQRVTQRLSNFTERRLEISFDA